ncbi:GNAT family N-acetyltransferase [Aeoliella mucimassa]|uniref:Putative acetyltransferase n=1 Tax=Aeoliella mucimassa TaxID=2527972 RepID=A0A518AJN4_9BACT|nr:GNAT family N-acetyltransferase [Aeoliella mucimassa]QDU54930.1 putative acetyltransferase [Aeoliella mucimassa]
MEVREIAYQSPEYQAELELRNQVLRIPLGLCVYDDPLDEEHDQWHYGLFNGQQLVGCVIALPKSPTHVKLRQMAIDASQQKSGCGRLLLTTVEQQLVGRGISSIELAARAVVAEFYEKLGYHRCGDEFVEVGIAHITMQKQLS